ncbi:hypothetical protein SLEP1_g59193 [Rubroshorea leprosula]|uniref:Uncharacterized protein n=1 Tax=Rubroshorea leprosula TaxID=152421 RepID=A0AAV5MW60_9ROSI|nr:hypothetical protein SLEP1_g59193 [Rubroshorea leprosula]
MWYCRADTQAEGELKSPLTTTEAMPWYPNYPRGELESPIAAIKSRRLEIPG